MTAPSPATLRFLAETLRSPKPRPSLCHRHHLRPHLRRSLTTATHQNREMEVDDSSSKPSRPSSPPSSSSSRPPARWSQTPPSMRAPIKSRVWRNVSGRHDVNKSPAKLDAMYRRFLGSDNAPQMLSDETKWLAVTHKSFDHGRRGFNDRLAFLGKRIVEKECSLGLIQYAGTGGEKRGSGQAAWWEKEDGLGRTPFGHPSTEGVEVLLGGGRSFLTHWREISKVAQEYGVPEVMRWVPKNPQSLQASGADMVYAQAVFAIVGAVALEKGAAMANMVAKERVLEPLGLKNPEKYERAQAMEESPALAELEEVASR